MVDKFRVLLTRLLRALCGAGLLSLLLAGCLPSTRVPLATVAYPAAATQRAETLVVFLPGRHNAAAKFETEGFVAAVRHSGLKADILAAEAHFGYYARQELVPRLHEDIVLPARAAGYRSIWLVGVSMGGLGALWYDFEHPGLATGIVVLAPYLGDPPIVNEIASAGGLAAWQSPERPDDDYQRILWRRLKDHLASGAGNGRIFLGYGLQDDFAAANGLLAALLPEKQVQRVAGGHDWATWRSLWERLLPRLRLQPSAPWVKFPGGD